MGKITVETCEIEGLKVITPTVFGDERGYFMETYNYNDYKAAGIDMDCPQRIKNSSLFQRILRMDLSYCPSPQNLRINVPIFITQTMKAG